MNKNKLKSYAPVARREFIQVVTERAKVLGLSHDNIEPVEVKGDVAIIAGRPFPLDVADRRKIIETQVRLKGFEQVMEEVAYTWFNRFVALRFMEVHDYLGHGLRVLSNPSGSDIPEILEKATSVDLTGLDKARVAELRLAGDKDAELYKLLLVTQCNALYRAMPFLFEWVSDASELLLPDNLLQTNSPLRKLVNEIPEEDWQEIEIVGWLYQFYISEKKDQVIGKVVKSEDIPAATQLFTPNWIVKYMVQNTLGRKWLMTYPDSSIRGQMEFYIKPAEQEPEVQAQLDAITPKELNPESLTFMDPACGSGHILVEAYDLFKQIYLERGYRTKDIPRLILEKNLFGLDIDDRAAQLAMFAVLMKARADDRRILDPESPVKLNILSIQESKGMDGDKIAEVLLRERVKEISTGKPQQQYLIQPKVSQASLSVVEKSEVSNEELFSLLNLFKDAKTFGSLLSVHEKLKDALPKFERLIAKAKTLDVQSQNMAKRLLPLLEQTGLLERQYDFVVANPPYMGSKGLNPKLKEYAKDNYPDSKSDLFAMFIERGFEMTKGNHFNCMVTMQSWMFLSSYENLRKRLIDEAIIDCMVHMANMVMGIAFGTAVSVWQKIQLSSFKGNFSCVNYEDLNEENVPKEFPVKNERLSVASAADFKKIPGSPIAYWVSEEFFHAFRKPPISEIATSRVGCQTGDNNRFLRLWHEVSFGKFKFISPDKESAESSGKKWFPYNKGGSYRKWFGNSLFVVNWDNKGEEIFEYARNLYGSPTRTVKNSSYYFRESVTWSKISSGIPSFRYQPPGAIFDVAGASIFCKNKYDLFVLLAQLNSRIAKGQLEVVSPTLNYETTQVASLPCILKDVEIDILCEVVDRLIKRSENDWNLYERSWHFKKNPLLNMSGRIDESYASFGDLCNRIIDEQSHDEILVDEIVDKAYDCSNKCKRKIHLQELSLDINPYYRYGGEKTEDQLGYHVLSNTIKELISYAIGCMMGRFSLCEPGLIYAHSGNEGFDSSRYTTFPADEDGIVPVMDDDWFEDDATKRFVEFLKVAWSPETLDENLTFVADSLEPKRGESPVETIRRFISTKFFKDHHLKVYKKRPIYWLFSSGKNKAFECLVYLHRYNEMTLARMRSAYVTPLQGKISARLEYLKKEVDAASSTSSRKQFQKNLDTMTKKQQELREFDEKLRHYADLRINLDLDDGVKVNYGKFGDLLAEVKAVTGDKADGD